MNYFYIGIAILLIASYFAYSYFQDRDRTWEFIEVPEAAKELKSNKFVIFIDVREDDELFETGRIPGAVHIPLGQLSSERSHLDSIIGEDSKIIVYCRSGGRSKRGASIISKFGFPNVYSMNGGMMKWIALGNKVEPK
jgi:rhodanese-related sulfurtransferase